VPLPRLAVYGGRRRHHKPAVVFGTWVGYPDTAFGSHLGQTLCSSTSLRVNSDAQLMAWPWRAPQTDQLAKLPPCPSRNNPTAGGLALSGRSPAACTGVIGRSRVGKREEDGLTVCVSLCRPETGDVRASRLAQSEQTSEVGQAQDDRQVPRGSAAGTGRDGPRPHGIAALLSSLLLCACVCGGQERKGTCRHAPHHRAPLVRYSSTGLRAFFARPASPLLARLGRCRRRRSCSHHPTMDSG
jgi:hypothetical protein